MTGANVELLESTIALVAARCLRTPSRLDVETPFVLLGLDSLAAVEMAVELERTLGIDVHPDLLDECATVRALARRLGEAAPAAASQDDPLDRMRSDAVLPDDVRPARRMTGAPASGLEQAQSVLLTGATGFLGAWILRTLIERTEATITCLVRAAAPGRGADDAATRLGRALAAAGVDVERIRDRVRIVEGDLQHPRLGLDAASADRLGTDIDAICHAGAAVNWVSSYDGLRGSNVTGTLELLRFASDRRAIPFHFVSSLSVCYSTSGPAEADEAFDPLPHLGGVHLGYAQTKVVAEALVRQAGARGLPFTISRPALVSGDSRTGAFNRDDVLAALVAGCVRMGVAPDLDWRLDCEPVDVVAEQIVRLSQGQGETLHLAHPHPRHWRECVLWMQLYGYPVRLVPYHAWLRQLDREAVGDHPLRGLRPFFLHRPHGAGGHTLPELYEDVRRTAATAGRTLEAAAADGLSHPPLDAALLQTYFDAYVSSGHLPPPDRQPVNIGTSRHASRTATPDEACRSIVERMLGTTVRSIDVLGSGSDHSIVSELASWRSGETSGLYRLRLDLDVGGRHERRDVMLKVKPPDRQVLDVGEAIARVAGDALGETYSRWAHLLEPAGGHLRELAICRQTDPRFTRHTPRVLGTLADPSRRQWSLLLEWIDDGVLIDSVDRPDAWTGADIGLAIDGLAALHAIWYDRTARLDESWIGHVRTTASMADMRPLWGALADHAAPAFSSWCDPETASAMPRLIDSIDRWWPDLGAVPRTLIHNDFNPRNICLRRDGPELRLCAYDWELSTVGAPQRDLAELLCFLLPSDASHEAIDGWVEHSRQALAREADSEIDQAAWRAGFRAAVFDLMVTRLPMYALVHRIRRQSFLPRVVRTWQRLYEHVGE